MPMTPELRQKRIATALTSVKAAQNARRLFDHLEEGHRAKTTQNDDVTREYLEETIQRAMGYGYPVEAVADAAAMTTAEVIAIAEDSTAA
ncbi:MAG: hypothetical protein HKN94_12775 [Acidimicrobiales bacterium]|nr:hypothetical protein [Acidimicrobiales bacterium]RZV42373.1 MAG: hypothetical protein EX269_14930 [Acidimicrobiales bacterium]